jgi:spore maturation protein CgeB
MKIFIPTQYYNDSFADNVRMTLESMGHNVRMLGQVDPSRRWSIFIRFHRRLNEFIPRKGPSQEESHFLEVAKEYKPDVFLCLTQSVHPEILLELRKYCKGRRVLWWGDCPANSREWGILDQEWDFVYLKDRSAVGKLRLVGRNVYLMHEAMNPAWHKPLAQQNNHEMVVAGSCYAYRQAIVLRLMGDGVGIQLYGQPPPRWADPRIVRCHTGRYVVCEDKSRVFGEGMACLNTFSLNEGNSLNCRAFEIAGAGGLQMIEARPAISECFDPGKDLLVFETYEELLGHIDRARRYPAEMQVIRDSGVKRALAEHTYRHRLDVILKKL